MKKTSEYAQFFYNKGHTDLIINDLNLKIKAHRTEDIFKLNPNISADMFIKSYNYGDLYHWMSSDRLLHLLGPPTENIEVDTRSLYDPPTKPIPSRSKSMLLLDQSVKNYVDQLEAEFLEGEGTLSDQKEVELKEKFIQEVDLDGFSDPLKE
jgi:hypothetical protein